MNYDEMALKAVKPNLKPFEAFTLFGTYSQNGYVVIPNNLPIDYFDDIYKKLDQEPYGGLTFGGYVTQIGGDLKLLYLDEYPLFNECEHSKEEINSIENIKKLCVRAIGFDDNHIWVNKMNAHDGSIFLSKQLENLVV